MKSLRSKIMMCVLAVVSFTKIADAAQIIVFEAPLDRNQEVSAEFAANRELGRAWIDVQVESTNPGGEGLLPREVVSKAVEGLYYDPVRKQVVYRTPTGTIVCAEDAKFLWRTYLKSTGQCLITPVTELRKTDDGFKIRERTVAKVVFETQSSADSPHASK